MLSMGGRAPVKPEIAMRFLPVFLLLVAIARAAEYAPEGQRWVVEIHACHVDTRKCETFRRPVDTEGALCEFGMMKSEVEWSREHPGYRVDEYHCSKADDTGI
jgi:hypothetical protein